MKALPYTLLLVSLSAAANPFVVSDPYPAASTPKPTNCGVLMDAVARTEIPVTIDTTGTYCKLDLAGIATGAHTLKMTNVLHDAVWGTLESAQSAPLAFTKPGSPGTPSGLLLTP